MDKKSGRLKVGDITLRRIKLIIQIGKRLSVEQSILVKDIL